MSHKFSEGDNRVGPVKTQRFRARAMAQVKHANRDHPKKDMVEQKANKSRRNTEEQVVDSSCEADDIAETKEQKKSNKRKEDGTDVEEEALDTNLANDSKAIRELVCLIPSIHYQAPDADRQQSLSLKYMKKSGNTVSEKVARAKKNRKKAKFDPKSTGDKAADKEDDSDQDESDPSDSEPDEPAAAADGKPRPAATTRVTSVAELRARLQARIQQIRGGRPEPSDGADDPDGGEGRKRKREERKEEKKKKKKKEK